MFGQTFSPHDIFVIGVLIVLEGVLSIDNALVLGLLARRLPKALQAKALTYGLIGALVFRLLAIATASYLLHWRIAKLFGGLYLVYVAMKHFIWVVLVGGMLGVALMRFAAVIFIKLLEKFPRFETSAYLLVILIGLKLVLDFVVNTPANPERLDFHSPEDIAFWLFWGLMAICFGI